MRIFLNLKKKLIILSIIYFCCINLKTASAQDTLFVNEDILVSECQVLTIPAGTVVMFNGFYFMEIMGTLIADGSEEEPIKFTTADTLNLHNTNLQAGGWNGIRFVGRTETTSVLNHCIFEFSKATILDYENGGAITVAQPKIVEISNSVFRHNYAHTKGGAVYLIGGNSYIKYSLFHDNIILGQGAEHYTYGGAIYMHENCSAEISWSVFENNYCSGIGGAVAIEDSNPFIFNNIFDNNDAPLGGALGLLRTDVRNPIANNLITNNHAMFFGGGVAFIEASGLFTNNNIMNNYAGYGGGIYLNEASKPSFYNSIIRNNEAYPEQINQVFIWDVLSAPQFYNCNVEGGLEGFDGGAVGDGFLGVYENNIDDDPMFDSSDEFQYALLSGSPCIDAGYEHSAQMGINDIDLIGNDRFSGFFIDIGVFEYQHDYFSLSIEIVGDGETDPPAGAHDIPQYAEMNVNAIPSHEWIFEYYTISNDTITDNPIVFEMANNIELKAHFSFVSNIVELSKAQSKVFPNPAESFIFIEVEAPLQNEIFSTMLFDNKNILLYKLENQKLNQQFLLPYDFSKLTPGIYYLLIETAGYKKVHKILKH